LEIDPYCHLFNIVTAEVHFPFARFGAIAAAKTLRKY
jgi:hypothetical protein